MPYFRVGQRPVLVRPAFPNQQTNPRPPVYQQPPPRPVYQQPPPPPVYQQSPPPPPAVARNQLPQHLPVLHPPFFPKENEFYEEEEQEQQEYEEVYGYPTMVFPDQHRTITQQFRAYRSLQNYPRQHLIRPVIPRHPAYIYYHR